MGASFSAKLCSRYGAGVGGVDLKPSDAVSPRVEFQRNESAGVRANVENCMSHWMYFRVPISGAEWYSMSCSKVRVCLSSCSSPRFLHDNLIVAGKCFSLDNLAFSVLQSSTLQFYVIMQKNSVEGIE